MKKITAVQFLTRTAMVLALAIVFQNLRALIGVSPQSTLIIGSLVNLSLIVATGGIGIASGVIISLITPIVAMLQGQIPLPIFAPVIAIGNMSLVFVFYYARKTRLFSKLSDIVGVVLAALVKWGAMYYFGIVFVLNTIIPEGQLKPAQVNMIAINFNIPQLVTALIGGVLGVIVLRILFRSKVFN